MTETATKGLKIVSTSGWARDHGASAFGWGRFLGKLWTSKPYDMLVIKIGEDGSVTVSIDGYHRDTGVLVEGEVIVTFQPAVKLEPEVFWFKVDEYDEFFAGTILYPEEY